MRQLNAKLSHRDKLKTPTNEMLKEREVTFSRRQSHFTGISKAYQPAMEDDLEYFPNEYKKPITSVDAQLDYAADKLEGHLNSLLSVERTNASGNAKAELIVDGISFGEFSTIELLQLDKVVNRLKQVHEQIPTFDPQQDWQREKTEEGWYQTSPIKTVKSTNDKTWEIVAPASQYQKEATVKEVTKIRVQGHYTTSHYSTMISPAEKNSILERDLKMLLAIEDAMKTANMVEVIEVTDGRKILDYLHGKL